MALPALVGGPAPGAMPRSLSDEASFSGDDADGFGEDEAGCGRLAEGAAGEASAGRALTPDSGSRLQYQSLQRKVSSRVESTSQVAKQLEETLEKVREAYRLQLELLKSLELERIDLEAAAQWLGATRENWRGQLAVQNIQPPLELDKLLAGEGRGVLAEARAAASNITKVSAQVQQLRRLRDSLEVQLSEKRHKLRLEVNLLDHCRKSMHVLDERCIRPAAPEQASAKGSAVGRRRSSGLLSHPQRGSPGRRRSDIVASAKMSTW